MRRSGLACLILAVLLVFALPTLAQDTTPEPTAEATLLPDLTETYTSKDGAVSFCYPQGWEVSEKEGNDVIVFTGDIIMPNDGDATAEHRNPSIIIIIWRKVDEFFVDPGYDDIAFGVALFNRMDETAARPPDDRIIGDVTTLKIGNKRAAWFLIQFGFADSLNLAVEEAPNTVSYLQLGTEVGETDQWKGTLLAIAESIQLHQTQTDTPATDSP